jgi:hypothetical protein
MLDSGNKPIIPKDKDHKMLAMQTTDYADVFQETIKYTGNQVGDGTWFGFLVVSFIIGMWFMSGMPGFPNVSHKAHMAVVWTGCALVVGFGGAGTVMGIMNLVTLVAETNKLEDVQTRMEENVAKKYDAKLEVALTDIPAAEDRDKPNDYTLVFNSEDKEKRVIQRYEISFDHATSEPFISELEAPTADELEVSAKK